MKGCWKLGCWIFRQYAVLIYVVRFNVCVAGSHLECNPMLCNQFRTMHQHSCTLESIWMDPNVRRLDCFFFRYQMPCCSDLHLMLKSCSGGISLIPWWFFTFCRKKFVWQSAYCNLVPGSHSPSVTTLNWLASGISTLGQSMLSLLLGISNCAGLFTVATPVLEAAINSSTKVTWQQCVWCNYHHVIRSKGQTNQEQNVHMWIA